MEVKLGSTKQLIRIWISNEEETSLCGWKEHRVWAEKGTFWVFSPYSTQSLGKFTLLDADQLSELSTELNSIQTSTIATRKRVFIFIPRSIELSLIV